MDLEAPDFEEDFDVDTELEDAILGVFKPKIKLKVLVTGAEGFVGRHLSEILEEKGYEVTRTDIKSKSSFLPGNFYYADLTRIENVQKVVNLKDFDIIFHTAAIFDFSVPLMKLIEVNVLGTLNLISEAIRAGVKKMVMWSSAAVYGECSSDFYIYPISEHSKLNPNFGGNYDLSKRLQERIALRVSLDRNFKLTIIRPVPIYGKGSYYGMYNLMKLVKEHSLPAVPRNFHEREIPMVHVDDVCEAAIYLSDLSRYNYEIYNVCDDYTLDMIDTMRYIAHLTQGKVKILIPIHFKILKVFKPIMNLLGKMSAWIAKKFRSGARPKIETDTMNYMFGNYFFSNRKILNMGFHFKYGDRRKGLLEVISWYNKNGWNK